MLLGLQCNLTLRQLVLPQHTPTTANYNHHGHRKSGSSIIINNLMSNFFVVSINFTLVTNTIVRVTRFAHYLSHHNTVCKRKGNYAPERSEQGTAVDVQLLGAHYKSSCSTSQERAQDDGASA